MVDEILDPAKCEPVKCHVASRVTMEKAFIELSFSHSEFKRQSYLTVDDDEVSFYVYSDKWFEDLQESYFELLEKSDQKLYDDRELEEFFNFNDDEFDDNIQEADNEEDTVDEDCDLVVKDEEEPRLLFKVDKQPPVDKSIEYKAASPNQIVSNSCRPQIFSGGVMPMVTSVFNDYNEGYIIDKVVLTVDLAGCRKANLYSSHGLSGHYLPKKVGVYTKEKPPDNLPRNEAQPICDGVLFQLSRGFVTVKKGPDLLNFSLNLQDKGPLPVGQPKAVHFLGDQESYAGHLPMSSESSFIILLDTSHPLQLLRLPRISMVFSGNVVIFSFLCSGRDLWLMYRGFVRVKKGPDLSSFSLLFLSADLHPPDLPELMVLSSISQQAQKKVPTILKVPDIPPLPPDLFTMPRLSQLLHLGIMKRQAAMSWMLVNLVMWLQGQYMVYKVKVLLTAMV